MTYPWIFQDIERTIRYFWTGFLATCVKFQWSNMTLPGSLDLDPGSQGKPMNSWCVSFETECTMPFMFFSCHRPIFTTETSPLPPPSLSFWQHHVGHVPSKSYYTWAVFGLIFSMKLFLKAITSERLSYLNHQLIWHFYRDILLGNIEVSNTLKNEKWNSDTFPRKISQFVLVTRSLFYYKFSEHNSLTFKMNLSSEIPLLEFWRLFHFFESLFIHLRHSLYMYPLTSLSFS